MAFTEKYVTNSGAGAADGSSLANAWSWATMLTTLAAGQRANVQGAITRTTLIDIFTNAGTAANPIGIRGINSTLGDLEANGRTRGGSLVTTNFPVVTYTTGRITFPIGSIVEHCSFTSAAAAATVGSNNPSYFRRCSFANTHASHASATAMSLQTNVYVEDCDCTCASSSTSAYVINASNAGSKISNCLVTGNTSGCGGIYVGSYSSLAGIMIRDCNFGVLSAGFPFIRSCTFRNITNAYIKHTGSHIQLLNCVAWGTSGSSQWYNSGGTATLHYQANNFIGNMGVADADEGNCPVYSETTLTADPFVSSTDLTLNTTSGGGAAVRAAGYPAYMDGGVWQHQDAAVGGGVVVPTSRFGGEGVLCLN